MNVPLTMISIILFGIALILYRASKNKLVKDMNEADRIAYKQAASRSAKLWDKQNTADTRITRRMKAVRDADSYYTQH